MKKSILPLIIIVFLSISCENEIYLKAKNIPPILTMNGFIDADSIENRIYLSFTDKTTPTDVENMTVDVFINGEWKETAIDGRAQVEEYEGTKQNVFLIKSRFKPGDVVRIEAKSTDGKHHAWMEEKVPYPIDILELDTMSLVLSSYERMIRSKKLRLNIRFKDQVNTENYYRLSVEHITHPTFYDKETVEHIRGSIKYTAMWNCEDIVLTDGRPFTTDNLDDYLFENIYNLYGVFDDSRFKDSEYTMTTQSWVHAPYIYHSKDENIKNIKIDMVVKLLSITKAEYEYLKVLNYLQSDNYDDFINETVKVPSNVHGGTGMVGINSGSGIIMNTIFDFDYTDEYWENY